jgi:hypothetical protein
MAEVDRQVLAYQVETPRLAPAAEAGADPTHQVDRLVELAELRAPGCVFRAKPARDSDVKAATVPG